jgi:hypothetical protein
MNESNNQSKSKQLVKCVATDWLRRLCVEVRAEEVRNDSHRRPKEQIERPKIQI